MKAVYLTIAGAMVGIPLNSAFGNVSSTNYVDRIVNSLRMPDGVNALIGSDNKINPIYLDTDSLTISGSEITGYGNGSGSFVLIGSTTGGPYGGRTITDVLTGLSGSSYFQISGSAQILINGPAGMNWASAAAIGSEIGHIGGNVVEFPQTLGFSGSVATHMMIQGSMSGRGELVPITGFFQHNAQTIANTIGSYVKTPGSSITGFGLGTGTLLVVGGGGIGGSIGYQTVGVMGPVIASHIPGSMISGYASQSGLYALVGSGTGTAGWMQGNTWLSEIGGSSIASVLGSNSLSALNLKYTGSLTGTAHVMVKQSGSGNYSEVPVSELGMQYGNLYHPSNAAYKQTGVSGTTIMVSPAGNSNYGDMPIEQLGSMIPGSAITDYEILSPSAAATSTITYLPVFVNGKIVAVPFATYRDIMDEALPIIY